MSGMFFARFFVYFNAYFALSFSIDSAEADIIWGVKLNGYLIESCVRNKHIQNDKNLIICVQVRKENVGDVI